VHVVSRASWPDQIASDHALCDLAAATVLHSGRPTVVIVGVGAPAVGSMALHLERHQTAASSPEP
jgi:uroporphyrin-III C-methyltransferase